MSAPADDGVGLAHLLVEQAIIDEAIEGVIAFLQGDLGERLAVDQGVGADLFFDVAPEYGGAVDGGDDAIDDVGAQERSGEEQEPGELAEGAH